jgi:hypothetical protein
MFLLAQIISYVSNPLVIAFPTTYALVYKSTGSVEMALWWAISSLFFCAMIAVFVVYGVRKGFFNDLDVSERLKRRPLFIVGGIVSFTYFLVVLLLNGPRILLLALSGVILGIFLDNIINSRIKASVHVATFSAFVVTTAIVYGGQYVFLLFLIPVVAWARVIVKRHTLQETIVGALLGISLTTIMYVVMKMVVQ